MNEVELANIAAKLAAVEDSLEVVGIVDKTKHKENQDLYTHDHEESQSISMRLRQMEVELSLTLNQNLQHKICSLHLISDIVSAFWEAV
jgi:adenylate cyclase class IV